jgi:hypothetical protein
MAEKEQAPLDRAREEFDAALAAARLAVARAIRAMRVLRNLSRSPWRDSPLLAARRVAFELRWLGQDEIKVAEDARRRAQEKGSARR